MLTGAAVPSFSPILPPLRLLPIVVSAVSVCLAREARAQADLTLSAGVAQDARADAVVSPLHYQGIAPEIAVRIAHATEHWELAGLIDGGSTALSALAPAGGAARLDHGDLGVSALRRAHADGFAWGATVRTRLDVTSMRYQGAQRTPAAFAFGVASLEPTAQWRVPLRAGRVTFEVASPVVALIDQPYSDLKTERSVFAFRGATAQRFRGAHSAVSYALGHIDLAYRFGYVRYDDASPVRGLSQVIALGVRTHIGSPAGAP